MTSFLVGDTNLHEWPHLPHLMYLSLGQMVRDVESVCVCIYYVCECMRIRIEVR